MRRTLGLLSAAILVFTLAVAPPALADSPPPISARAWVLMDGTTGQILYQGNADTKNYPASTTKILTALVAVEHGKLTDEYTIDQSATILPLDSTNCNLHPGEQQHLKSLLYGLLLPSGNDCAVAIAQGEGNMDSFVGWMNEKVAALGLKNSHFTNPHGLHNDNHYTTARDLAVIAQAAFANDTIREISGTKSYTMPGLKHDELWNHNQLLFNYNGAIAGKTGFTDQAMATLVIAAKRDGRYLVGVILGEQYISGAFQDMMAMMDYGFGSFQNRTLILDHQAYAPVAVGEGAAAQVNVVAGAGFSISEDKSGKIPSNPEVTITPERPDKIFAPVHKGDKIGQLKVVLDGKIVGTIPLLAADEIAYKPSIRTKVASVGLMALKWLVYVMAVLVGLRVFGLTVRSIRRRRRARRSAYLRGSQLPAYRATSNRR